MKKSLLLGGGVLGGLVAGAMLSSAVFFMARPNPATNRPQLAGQTIKTDPIRIDFDRSIDLYLSPYSGAKESPRIFRGCKILGVIGDETHAHERSSYKGHSFFQNWLCIELDDGRRAYVPSSDVEYFVDSEAQLPPRK